MKLIGTYSKRAPTGGGYLIVTNVDAHLKRPLDPPPNQPNPRLAQQKTASPFYTVRLSPGETEVLSYLVTIYNQRSTLTKSTPGFAPRFVLLSFAPHKRQKILVVHSNSATRRTFICKGYHIKTHTYIRDEIAPSEPITSFTSEMIANATSRLTPSQVRALVSK